MALPKIVVIVGPTASGKSALGVALAKKFNGEVVSADSRQIYRGMDIGTGKVPNDKRRTTNDKLKKGYFYKGIRHHLLDIRNPEESFSVTEYQKRTVAAIKDILKRKKLPIIVGGTGLYIQAVVDNIVFPEVPPDPKIRKKLEKKTTEELFGILKLLDPARAKTIDRYNRRRLVRAIEISMKTKKPILPLQKGKQIFNPLLIGIKTDREVLREKIRIRLKQRLKLGMIQEVKNLLKRGVSFERLEGFGLEYRYVGCYLKRKISQKEMVEQLEKAIRDYARRQLTWFKRDKRIHWITNSKEAEALSRKFLQ